MNDLGASAGILLVVNVVNTRSDDRYRREGLYRIAQTYQAELLLSPGSDERRSVPKREIWKSAKSPTLERIWRHALCLPDIASRTSKGYVPYEP